MYISITPIFSLLLLESFFDFTTRILPELLYPEQLYYLEPTENKTEVDRNISRFREETTEKPQNLTDDQLKRQLCPDIPEEQNYSYRYDIKSRKCGTTGYNTLCGKNMVLYGQKNNTVYGYCDCASVLHDRTLIYHAETNQCYFIFEKGYCQEGQWLTLTELTGKPECKVNPCRKYLKKKATDEYVRYNSECVLLGSSCAKGRVIRFEQYFILPKCSSIIRISGFAVGALQPTCSPGSYISMTGSCISSWKW